MSKSLVHVRCKEWRLFCRNYFDGEINGAEFGTLRSQPSAISINT